MNATADEASAFCELVAIMGRLRSPGGCPWDSEQSWKTLRPYLVEETYELIEAIDAEDIQGVLEECGDVLLQVVFIAQIAKEKGLFTIEDVARHIGEKLVRRHPHVFGELIVEDSAEVSRNWENIKAKERKISKRNASLLAGVPRGLPAALRAFQIQERAAKVGFDWPEGDPEPVLEKVREEVEELLTAFRNGKTREIEEELGDLLFAVVNFGRHLGFNAEMVLQKANDKFIRRFARMEQTMEQEGGSWKDYSLEELEGFWQRAKQHVG